MRSWLRSFMVLGTKVAFCFFPSTIVGSVFHCLRSFVFQTQQ